MSKLKFIVVLTIPGSITAAELKTSLSELVDEVEGSRAKGILVDVTELSKDPKLFDQVANATGPVARQEIDPKLYEKGIRKIAFVSPSGKYPGRDPKAGPVSAGPIPGKGLAADKHYFEDATDAIAWLIS